MHADPAVAGGGDCLINKYIHVCVCTLEGWRSAVIVPLHKGKGERTECKNYRGISLLSVVGKIYAEILVDRVRRVTGGLIEDEQGGFRAGSGCVDQIFTLKQGL